MHSRPKLHLDGEGSEGRKEREDESGRKIVRTFAKLVEGLFSSAANFPRYIPSRGEGSGERLGRRFLRNGNFSFETGSPGSCCSVYTRSKRNLSVAAMVVAVRTEV